MTLHGSLWARRLIPILIVVWAFATSEVFAQDADHPGFLGPLVKRVVLDPTTYAPSIIAYDATLRDWKSSQPFFRSGLFVEHNARFTVSGRPDDMPVSYETGKRQILKDSLSILEISVVNNAADAIVERMLVDKYPEHRKLLRALGTVERIALASSLTYFIAAPHYRQWQKNEQMTARFGVVVSVPIQ